MPQIVLMGLSDSDVVVGQACRLIGMCRRQIHGDALFLKGCFYFHPGWTAAWADPVCCMQAS